MKGRILLLVLVIGLIPVSPVKSLDFTGSSITFNNTVVGGSESVVVTVTVSNSSAGLLAGALVTLTISSGQFDSLGQFTEFANNGQSVSGITPANGSLKIVWIAPDVNSTFPSIIAGFSAELSTPYFTDVIQGEVTVQAGLSDISNSILTVPDIVRPNANFTIEVTVFSATNQLKSGINVYVDVSDGSPVSGQEGISASDGKVTVSWRAPNLSLDTVNLTMNVRALISVSETVNITLSEKLNVVLSPSTSLEIIKPTLASVREKSDNLLKFGLRLNGSLPAHGGEINVFATEGLFYRTNTSYGALVDEEGYISLNWTAPKLPDIQPLTVNFRIEGRYVNLTVFESFNITVFPVYGNLTLEVTIKNKIFKQNEAILIEYFVYDNDTLNPIGGVSIFSTVEFGYFQESGLNEINIETNLRGKTQAILNLTEADFIVAYQQVTIYSNASKLKYFSASTTNDIVVQRVIPPGLDLDVLTENKESVQINESLDFTAIVTDLTAEPVSNVTVEISSDDGIFSNNKQVMRGFSGSDGRITFTWYADLTAEAPSVTVTLRITLISELYQGNGFEFKVVVSNPKASPATENIDTSGANKVKNSFYAIGGSIATVVIAASSIAVIYKRKN